jgi:hypothetical protein
MMGTKASVYLRVLVSLAAISMIIGGCKPPVYTKSSQQLAAVNLKGGVLATFNVNGKIINVWVTNTDVINSLYEMKNNSSLHLIPNGPILTGAGEQDSNLPYHWHFDPDLVRMTAESNKACDVTPDIVEQNVNEYIHQTGNYCPSGAVLVKLLDYRFPPPGILNG